MEQAKPAAQRIAEQARLLATMAETLQSGSSLQDTPRGTGGNLPNIYLLSPPMENEARAQILVLPAVPHKVLCALHDNLQQQAFLDAFERNHKVPQGDTKSGTRFMYSFESTGVESEETFYKHKRHTLNKVMYARARNHTRPQHCSVFSRETQRTLSDLEYLVNQLFWGVFPNMRKDFQDEIAKCKEKGLESPQIGKVRSKLSIPMTTTNKKLEKKNGYLTGYMTEGHHGFVEAVYGLFQTKVQSPQPYHIEDVLAKKRKLDLERDGKLEEYSYRVGYVLIIPLSLEGYRIDYIVKCANQNQLEVVHKHICFGSGLLVRMDVYRAGGYGSMNNWSVLATFLTPKTAYQVQEHHLEKVPLLSDGSPGLIYRNAVCRTDCAMYEFPAWKGTERATGNGNRLDEKLLSEYIAACPSPLAREVIMNHLGHDGFFDTKVQTRLGIKPTQDPLEAILCLQRKRHMFRSGKGKKKPLVTQEQADSLLLKRSDFGGPNKPCDQRL